MRFVLVHSPLVGPFTWELVAEVLRQRGAVNPFPASGGIVAAAPQVAEELFGLWRLAAGSGA